MATDDLTFEQLCELFNYTPRNRFLDTKDLSEICNLHASTFDHLRLRGGGPRYFKPAGTRRVWYSERDLLLWMASGARQSTSDDIAA